MLCDRIGHRELLDDSRFATMSDRRKNRDALTELLDAVLSSQKTVVWCERLQGTIPFAPVLGIPQALDSEFVRKNGKVIRIPYPDNPVRGEVCFVAPPFSFPGIPFVAFKPAPKLGEHTDEILRSAGYSDEEIRTLREEKVVL